MSSDNLCLVYFTFERLHDWKVEKKYAHLILKADMKSYIPVEMAALFFIANLFLKQGISSEYITVDFICMG